MRLLIIILLLSSNWIFAQTTIEKQIKKGIILFQKGKISGAERIFDKIIKTDEVYADAYVWKSKCLLHFEEFNEAYQHLEIAINLQPTHAPYYVEKGNLKVYIGQSAIQKAELCGDCGKYILPSNGNKIQTKDYYASAIEDYEKAIKFDAEYAAAYFQLAKTENMLGNKEKACIGIKKAIELKHPNAEKQRAEFCD